MATIEGLDKRTKEIENNLSLVSDEILKLIKRIIGVEEKLGKRFNKLTELEVEIKDIKSFLKEIDTRIRHFETVYKRRSGSG